MKISDMKCAVIGLNPVVRIITDEGICGYGQAEATKFYLKPHIMFYKPYLMGVDPTDVERCMLRIRRLGSFKPWGSAVSAIEIALWDIAGKAAGVPVYKLLGGKVRDKVRVYNGGVRFPMSGADPEDYAENMRKMKASKENFSIIKQGIAFHSQMIRQVPGMTYGEVHSGGHHPNRGPLTERGLKHIIACVEAMKDVLGDEVGLALDCGPGFMVPDAIRLAKALEPLNVVWLEDLITGDYTPYVMADLYREVTRSTSTPIHTGEQIYLLGSDRRRWIDGIDFPSQPFEEVSYGRWRDAGSDWEAMKIMTPGATNQLSVEESVIISEIMYHPADPNDTAEFIEICNEVLEYIKVRRDNLDQVLRKVFKSMDEFSFFTPRVSPLRRAA